MPYGYDRPPTPRGPERVLILDASARVAAEGHQPQHHNLVRALGRQHCQAERPPANVRGFVNLTPPRADSAAHYAAAIWRQNHDEHALRNQLIQRNLTPH